MTLSHSYRYCFIFHVHVNWQLPREHIKREFRKDKLDFACELSYFMNYNECIGWILQAAKKFNCWIICISKQEKNETPYFGL